MLNKRLIKAEKLVGKDAYGKFDNSTYENSERGIVNKTYIDNKNYYDELSKRGDIKLSDPKTKYVTLINRKHHHYILKDGKLIHKYRSLNKDTRINNFIRGEVTFN